MRKQTQTTVWRSQHANCWFPVEPWFLIKDSFEIFSLMLIKIVWALRRYFIAVLFIDNLMEPHWEMRFDIKSVMACATALWMHFKNKRRHKSLSAVDQHREDRALWWNSVKNCLLKSNTVEKGIWVGFFYLWHLHYVFSVVFFKQYRECIWTFRKKWSFFTFGSARVVQLRQFQEDKKSINFLAFSWRHVY